MIWFLILSLFGAPRKTLKESKIAENVQISFLEHGKVYTVVGYEKQAFIRQIEFLTSRDDMRRMGG